MASNTEDFFSYMRIRADADYIIQLMLKKGSFWYKNTTDFIPYWEFYSQYFYRKVYLYVIALNVLGAGIYFNTQAMIPHELYHHTLYFLGLLNLIIISGGAVVAVLSLIYNLDSLNCEPWTKLSSFRKVLMLLFQILWFLLIRTLLRFVISGGATISYQPGFFSLLSGAIAAGFLSSAIFLSTVQLVGALPHFVNYFLFINKEK